MAQSGISRAPQHTQPSPFSAGLRCRCPRCGQGRLFAGFLTVAERCSVCGLDLRKSDSGDGPAVLLIFFLGAVVVVLAIWIEIAYEPPMWVHAVVWPAVILVFALGLLRPLKAVMVALEYKHKIGVGENDAA
ncbi:MAG: DUF983 domain-containing protein [Rhodospirillaceae bacterium]|nr:DUF983 domain-containing protein [Rhodospirillaceae bacterium]